MTFLKLIRDNGLRKSDGAHFVEQLQNTQNYFRSLGTIDVLFGCHLLIGEVGLYVTAFKTFSASCCIPL